MKPKDITGLWLKASKNGEPEGFYLGPQGDLQLYNIFSWLGESWGIEGKSLLWLTATEQVPSPELSELHYSLKGDNLIISEGSYFNGEYQRAAVQILCGSVNILQQADDQQLSITLIQEDKKSTINQKLISRKVIANPETATPFTLAIASDLINDKQPYRLLLVLSDGRTIISRQSIEYTKLPGQCVAPIDL
ncbi:hypothetical protein [Sinobacterium caligoides]|nr:hypothetical protein [Sinobacterium caligoides]